MPESRRKKVLVIPAYTGIQENGRLARSTIPMKLDETLIVVQVAGQVGVIGAEVQTPETKEVAEINDLVINTSDGVVALVVLSNVPGKADTLTAVPFSLLSKSGERTYVLGTTEDKLAAAPSFNEEKDMNNVKWAQDDFRYFGQQPCWSE